MIIIIINLSESLLNLKRLIDTDVEFFEDTKNCNNYSCYGVVNIKVNEKDFQFSFKVSEFDKKTLN